MRTHRFPWWPSPCQRLTVAAAAMAVSAISILTAGAAEIKSFYDRYSFNEAELLKHDEIRLEAYNALNGMNWANPTLTVSASDFGRTNAQASGYYGRQLQYSAKLFF